MKPFDPQLYAENDDAKLIAVAWLIGRGWAADINPDQYGIDIVARKGLKNLKLEVEVKHNWAEGEFKFPTVHIPKRKLKFAEQPDSWFMVMRADRKVALVCSGESILKSPLAEVSNKLVAEGEQFFQVPLANFTKVEL